MRPARSRFPNINHNVMHDAPIPRPDLDRLYPPVLFETGRHRKILIFDSPGRRNLKRLGRQRQIGMQPVRPGLFRGRIPRIAFLRARICPFCKSFDILNAQRPVIRKMPATRIRPPRRHLARPHLIPNRLRPRPCFVVSPQRHGSDLPRAMAFLAVILENREDVAKERHRQYRSLHTYQYICFSDVLTQDCKRRIITYIGVSRC